MIQRTVKVRSLQANGRLDCKYFLSPGTQASERLMVAAAAGLNLRTIGGSGGLGNLWMPGRDPKCHVAPGEEGVPYLRAYDVFDYLPQAADVLSTLRTKHLSGLMASPGVILQTRSGRNLGPAVVVDSHLATFALSDDLIRISIADEDDRYYVLAFLSTPTGQALVRRDKTGSVIDHLSVGHLANVAVPFIGQEGRAYAVDRMRTSVVLREEARGTLAHAVAGLASRFSAAADLGLRKHGWSVQALTLGSRLDAAYCDPRLPGIRAELLANGGQRLRDVAEVRKPSGRYKTYYVDAAHGRALLSGRQVLQYSPINLQYMSPRSLDPNRYELHGFNVAFQADGRAEERLGVPVMIEPGRDGWLASGHVGRLVPRNGIDPGWLWAACSTEQVQRQMKALACGSVVDALYESDLEEVVLPPVGGVDGSGVAAAWGKFTIAAQAHDEAIVRIEEELSRLTGEAQIPA